MSAPMSQVEYDRIHVVNGMAYRMRDEFVSQATIDAQFDYKAARQAGIPWKVKEAAKRFEDSRRADVQRALTIIRGEAA